MNSPKYATFMPPLCQLMHAVSGIERRRKEDVQAAIEYATRLVGTKLSTLTAGKPKRSPIYQILFCLSCSHATLRSVEEGAPLK